MEKESANEIREPIIVDNEDIATVKTDKTEKELNRKDTLLTGFYRIQILRRKMKILH